MQPTPENQDPLEANTEKAYSIKDIGNGVTEEWIHDHQIVVYTIYNGSRQAVVSWYNAILATINDFTGSQVCLIHDWSALKSPTLNPYTRSKAMELTKQRSDIPIFVAGIFPKSIFSGIVMTFLRMRPSDRATFRVFSNRQQAIEWLKTKIG